MANFYGILQGNRGSVTRCGSKKSGVRATIKSRVNSINCWLYEENDKDRLDISINNISATKRKIKVYINGKEYRGKN